MKQTENKRLWLWLAAGLLLGLAACNEEPAKKQEIRPVVIPASSPTPITVPSNTPMPTEYAAPTTAPTSAVVPTETPTPEPTESPTPTATPSPTATPTPVWKGTDGEVMFSEAGYFFSETVTLELSTEKEGYITYTMDGSEPEEDSTRYEAPLLLEGTGEASPKVYSIRAKAWYADGSSSDTYVHTYFVGEKVKERYSTIVFSINGNPADLTEGPEGILYGTNYENRGRASERVVSVEAVSADGRALFSQYAGVRVYGGSSREFAVKSLKLYARKEYQEGMGTFETTVFGSTTSDGTKLIKKYDKLVLRNGGDDFQHGFIRDELAQRLGKKYGFDAYEAVVPAVAYLNGEYYGFYWLHESYCDKYFQYRNGKSDGEYVVLEGSDRYKSLKSDEAEYAAAKEYNRTYLEFTQADLTKDSVYADLCDWIDVENYLEYMAFNMYISNYDWPQGNFRCFRYYAAEGEVYGTGEKDGRWRFLLHDADVGFATYNSTGEKGAARNDISQVLNPSHDRYSALLAGLLKREDCRSFFIDKMIEYRDGVLSYESICETLDAMCAERDAELSYYFEHLDSLKNTAEDIYAKPGTTKNHIQKIKDFAKFRGEYITKYLEEYFGVDL